MVSPLPPEESPILRAISGEEFDDHRIWVGTDPASQRALSVSSRTAHGHAGVPTASVPASSDVTDLVQAARAREVFERSVSHELRTPLTSVLGNVEILLDAEDLPEAVLDRLAVVHRNATRLRCLVSDLLDPAAGRTAPWTLSVPRSTSPAWSPRQ